MARVAPAARHRSLWRAAGLRQEVRPEEDGLFPRGPDCQARAGSGAPAMGRGRPMSWSRPTATPSSSSACAASAPATITRRSADASRSTSGSPAASRSSFRPAAKATTASCRSTWPTRSASTASPTTSTATSAAGSTVCGPGASTRRAAFNAIPPVTSEKRFPYVTFVPVPAPRLGNLGVGLGSLCAGPGGQVRRGLCKVGGPQGQRSAADRLLHQQRAAAGRRAQGGPHAARVPVPIEGPADRAAWRRNTRPSRPSMPPGTAALPRSRRRPNSP